MVRQDIVRTSISDPASIEARILARAGARLSEVCADAGLEEERQQQLVTMAKEAAEVLLVLHHDGQTLSDFQVPYAPKHPALWLGVQVVIRLSMWLLSFSPNPKNPLSISSDLN